MRENRSRITHHASRTIYQSSTLKHTLDVRRAMPGQNASYAIFLFATTGVLIAVALYAWQRRTTAGAAALAWLALAVAEWVMTYALELASADMATKVLWAKLQYLGIVNAPLAWLTFTLQYTGKARRPTRRGLAVLLIKIGRASCRERV